MNARLFLAMAVLLAGLDAASAHAVFGVTGFAGGLLHALAVPSHAMAVAALALLIGHQDWGRAVPVVFAVAVVTGLGAIALAYVPSRAEEGLLASAAVAGLAGAFGRPLPRALGGLIAAATGLSLALDSPPEAIVIFDANMALVATALGAVALLVLLSEAVSRLRREWQRVGARILGSWIAASAILVLALRLAA